MIFAREISGPLTSLVKQLNDATLKHKNTKLGSFVVFLSDENSFAEKVISLADKEKIEQTTLGVVEAEGPEGYDVAADADVTVVLYTNRTTKVNYAFKKGKMTTDDVTRIVSDLAKILPAK
jgi:hypothetical protein